MLRRLSSRASGPRRPGAASARRITVCALVLLGLLGGVGLQPVTAQSATEAELSDARARLDRIGDELDRARAEERDAAAELEQAEEHLAEIERIVNRVASDVERQRAAVGDAEQRLAEVIEESERLAEAFEERLSRLYKQGPDLTFEVLFSSTGTEDALARTVMLEQLLEGDQVDLQRLEAAETAVASEEERLAAEQQDLEELLAEQQQVMADAQELRRDRALVAAAASAEVDELHSEHAHLEEEEAELEELIKERQREAERREREAAGVGTSGSARPSTSGSSASGYAWPMCAPLTSGYGPRWGRMHRGVDLGAGTGTPIGAAKAGSVIFAGWQGGYGQVVLVSHGDGVVTAYAHMSRISVRTGASVSQGQQLGAVGSTGNSTGPHLHLETRVNGTAVNPRQYLPGSPC